MWAYRLQQEMLENGGGVTNKVSFKLDRRSGMLTLAGCQVPTKDPLSLPSSVRQGKKKYDKKFMGRDKNRERSLTNCHHGQNRLDLGKLV